MGGALTSGPRRAAGRAGTALRGSALRGRRLAFCGALAVAAVVVGGSVGVLLAIADLIVIIDSVIPLPGATWSAADDRFARLVRQRRHAGWPRRLGTERLGPGRPRGLGGERRAAPIGNPADPDRLGHRDGGGVQGGDVRPLLSPRSLRARALDAALGGPPPRYGAAADLGVRRGRRTASRAGRDGPTPTRGRSRAA